MILLKAPSISRKAAEFIFHIALSELIRISYRHAEQCTGGIKALISTPIDLTVDFNRKKEKLIGLWTLRS